MLDKLGAFCLGEDEIAGRKFADVAILERTAEIFRTGFNPVFADLNLCARNVSGSAGALACCFWRPAKNLPAGPRGACQCGRGARAPPGTRLLSGLNIDN